MVYHYGRIYVQYLLLKYVKKIFINDELGNITEIETKIKDDIQIRPLKNYIYELIINNKKYISIDPKYNTYVTMSFDDVCGYCFNFIKNPEFVGDAINMKFMDKDIIMFALVRLSHGLFYMYDDKYLTFLQVNSLISHIIYEIF